MIAAPKHRHTRVLRSPRHEVPLHLEPLEERILLSIATLANLSLKPLDLNLLGLEVKTNTINVRLTTQSGNGQLLGNLLSSASSLLNLSQASTALNTVLGSAVNLLNSASLKVTGIRNGALTTAANATLPILNVSLAPVHLNVLGVNVDADPIQLTVTAHSGQGLILGNALGSLANLFNPPLPNTLNVNFINSKLQQLLTTLNQQIPNIASAPVPTVAPAAGKIASLTVPPINLSLLGLNLKTSAITVNADAQSGNGLLLGNVLTTALNTLNATPQNLADLSNNLNAVLGKVVGVLNATTLTLDNRAVKNLPSIIKTLTDPKLISRTLGSSAQILNLAIASSDPASPPVNVNLLGLHVTTSNINATLSATTGENNILGNLLYNVANLANPGAPGSLIQLLNLLGSGTTSATAASKKPAPATPPPTVTVPPQQLLQIHLKPLNLNILGLQVTTDPITVTISTQQANGNLLGNVVGTIGTLINTTTVNNAVNNALSAVVDLANSASLSVTGVGTGIFDTAAASSTPVLDLMVAPVHLNLLGLLVDTNPIHVNLTANSGNGLVLGNVLTSLANLFNPPLPNHLDLDFINNKLQQLLSDLNTQFPGINPVPVPPVTLGPGQVASLTVPAINLNLLGLLLNTTPITVNAANQTGNGLLVGNLLTTLLNTVDATPANLSTLSNNLNALLAKVVAVLNASSLTLSNSAVASLPSILQTLASPTLLTVPAGSTANVLDLSIATPDPAAPPVNVNLLGLTITTSNISAHLLAQTGDGQILGNVLYNVANLLNPGASGVLLPLLTDLGQLPSPLTTPALALAPRAA